MGIRRDVASRKRRLSEATARHAHLYTTPHPRPHPKLVLVEPRRMPLIISMPEMRNSSPHSMVAMTALTE